jgi:aspartyl-tRNA(Asn)/glutamyl-tRNA(Gln) amidotransferase subunit A
MTDQDLAFASIAELAPRLAAREISPVEVTDAALARIEQLEPKLNAYITVTAESARHAARASEAAILAGHYHGPLHGIPVAIKDLYATRGVATTFGSPLYADWVPDFDAAAVEQLKRAGAVLLGKTNLHELAYGSTSANAHYGAVHNPWRLDHHPGGSSGGSSAAVAAGVAYAAMGSDTGASIRQPAACTGIVGIKPTFGRLSKFGALPLAWSQDHAGPLTRTVGDAALVLQALAGHDPRDPSSVARPVPDFSAGIGDGIAGLRIGVARAFFFDDCAPGVVDAIEAALGVLEELGALIEEVALPDMDAAYTVGTVTIAVEGAAVHAADLRERPELFSDELRAAFELGSFYSGVDYVQAQRVRRQVMQATERAMAGFDAVVMPTSPVPATAIESSPPEHAMLRPRNTMPFNVLGLPGISVPCGFTGDGLPVGLQIIGKAFDEAGVLRIAHAYEQATEWHRRRPPLG